jgi:hypothetical protein
MRSRILRLALALAVTVVCTGSLLAAGADPVAAPEIDGLSLSTALGALAAGVMIVRARSHRK